MDIKIITIPKRIIAIRITIIIIKKDKKKGGGHVRGEHEEIIKYFTDHKTHSFTLHIL
jgi:hypothetical protein